MGASKKMGCRHTEDEPVILAEHLNWKQPSWLCPSVTKYIHQSLYSPLINIIHINVLNNYLLFQGCWVIPAWDQLPDHRKLQEAAGPSQEVVQRISRALFINTKCFTHVHNDQMKKAKA